MEEVFVGVLLFLPLFMLLPSTIMWHLAACVAQLLVVAAAETLRLSARLWQVRVFVNWMVARDLHSALVCTPVCTAELCSYMVRQFCCMSCGCLAGESVSASPLGIH